MATTRPLDIRKSKNRAAYDGAIKYDIYGRPVDGRSGGGLFNEKGELIGICNAAAVEVDEGIYTALETMHWQIAQVNLEHLFQDYMTVWPAAVPSRCPLPERQTQTEAIRGNRLAKIESRPVRQPARAAPQTQIAQNQAGKTTGGHTPVAWGNPNVQRIRRIWRC